MDWIKRMADTCVVGLDLGGTNIKAILADAQGTVLADFETCAAIDEGVDAVLHRLGSAAREVCELAGTRLEAVAGVGIGCPGPLDPEQGLILQAANLPGWRNVHLRARLQDLTARPVVLLNDANAAAYGEFSAGAGKDASSLCLLTLGTGIGGGAILNGEPLQGAFGNGAELGHMVLFPDGRQCGCGQRGCLEAYAGGAHVVQQAHEGLAAGKSSTLREVGERNGNIAVHDIVAAAADGDALASEVWDQACRAIALACANMIHFFEPQLILFAGGVSAAGQRLLDPVTKYCHDYFWKLAPLRTQIRLAGLGGAAGAIGAASWFRNRHHM